MEQTGQGVISSDNLMQRLVQAKKVMNKVEMGNFERGNVNENILRSDPSELTSNKESIQTRSTQQQTTNVNKIMESKLPDSIKKAMIDNPIPSISLGDSLDLNFVEKTKKLMENEGVGKKSPKQSSSSHQSNSGDLVKELTPLIENIVRKTVMEVMDSKLNQILTAQQTLSINENLVLKVGDSIFKGKITGVNKSK